MDYYGYRIRSFLRINLIIILHVYRSEYIIYILLYSRSKEFFFNRTYIFTVIIDLLLCAILLEQFYKYGFWSRLRWRRLKFDGDRQ